MITYYITFSAVDIGSFKKVKGDNFYEKFKANNSVTFNIGTSDASKENRKIFPIKSNKVYENKNLVNCTSENKLSNSYNNEKDDLSIQMSSHKMDDIRHKNQAAGNYLEEDITSLNVQQNSENPVVKKTYSSNNCNKCKNPIFFPLTNVHDTSLLNSNLTNNQDAKNKGNMHSTSNIIMQGTNMNPQTIVVNQSVTLNANVPVVARSNQMKMLEKSKVVLIREKVFANVSSPGDSSSNSISVSNLLKKILNIK